MHTPKWLLVFTYVLLAIWVVVAIFPLYWMVTLSFKNLRLITTGPFFFP